MKKNIKIGAIIPARMTSTRLPGKVLMDVQGSPMLWHLIERIKYSEKINSIILAIPDSKENDQLEVFAKKYNLKYFRGSEENVLKRFYDTAESFKIDAIVRITSDCPLIDPEIVDLVIGKYLESKADYASNVIERTFPRGLDTEVFSFETLQKTYQEAREARQKEHVVPYICENPDKFRIISIKNKKDFSHMRWTVDEVKDLEFVQEVFKGLYQKGKIFLMKDIIGFLEKHPEIIEINKEVKQKTI